MSTTNLKQSFLEQLRASQLLEAEQLADLAALPEARDPDPRPLARIVFQRGWLTRFQINWIVSGKGAELTVGPYALMERLGEGGMGQVFKAEHRRMHRIVALKIIRKEKLASPDSIKRFYSEVQAAAHLNHPNIVLAFDANQDGNTHYLAMEYVDGVDLARIVKETGPLSIAQACEYARQTAQGLHHAHERGLVHRDIKPHNLLLMREGDNGKPLIKILDMGLARLQHAGFEKERAVTQAGAVLGTPDYLAPEQAIDARTVDTRSDLYSLGCTMHFLLTGKPPFHAETLTQLLLQHQMTEPTSLSELRPGIPAPLAAVVRKLMAKRPEDRFASATEVATALEKVARGGGREFLVTTQAPLPVARVAEAPASDLWNTIVDAPTAPQRSLSTPTLEVRPPSREIKSNRKLYVLAGLSSTTLIGLVVAVLIILAGGKNDPPPDDPPNQPKPINPVGNNNPVRGEEKMLLVGHTGEVTALALSPDGRWVVSGGADKTVRLWELNTEKNHVLSTLEAPIKSVTFSPDSKTVYASTGGKELRWWDVETRSASAGQWPIEYLSPSGRHGAAIDATNRQVLVHSLAGNAKQVPAQRLPNGPWRMLFAADDAQLIVVTDQEILAYHLRQQTVKSVSTSTAATLTAVCSPRGDFVLVSKADGTLWRWNLDEERTTSTTPGRGEMRVMTVLPDQRRLAFVDKDHALHVWDPVTSRDALTCKPSAAPVLSLTVSADGKQLLTGGADGGVRVWDLSTLPALPAETTPTTPEPNSLPPKVRLLADKRDFGGLLFSPDEQRLVTNDRSGNLTVWEVETGKELASWTRGFIDGSLMAFSKDGKRLLTATVDGKLLVHDLKGEYKALPKPPIEQFSAITLSPDGKRAAAVGMGRDAFEIHLYDVERNVRLRAFAPGNLTSIAFSPDTNLIYGISPTRLSVWTVLEGQLVKFQDYPLQPQGCQFSPDGKLAALLLRSGELRIVDVDRGNDLVKLNLQPAEMDRISELRFVQDNRYLVATLGKKNPTDSGAKDRLLLRAWDLKDGSEVRRLVAPPGLLRTADVSSEGQLLVTITEDRRLLLWDLELTPRRTTPPSKQDSVILADGLKSLSGLEITPDNRTAALADGFGNLYVWDLVDRKMKAKHSNFTGVLGRMRISPDAQSLLWADGSERLHLSDLTTGKKIRSMEPAKARVLTLAISPDGTRAVSAGGNLIPGQAKPQFVDCEILFWDLTTGKLLQKWVGHTNMVFEVVFSADGKLVYSYGHDAIRVWNTRTGQVEQIVRTPVPANLARFSADGRYLLTGGSMLHLWEVQTGKQVANYPLPGRAQVFDVRFLGQNRIVAALSGFKPRTPGTTTPPEADPDLCTVIVWDRESRKELHTFKGHTGLILRVLVTREEQGLLTCSYDGSFRLWNLNPSTEVALNNLPVLKEASRFDKIPGPADKVLFSPDGLLAFSAEGTVVHAWDLVSGKEKFKLATHTAPINSLAISQDGRTLAVGCTDKKIHIWDVVTGMKKRFFTLPDAFDDVLLSPNGPWVLVRYPTTKFNLYNWSTIRETASFEGAHTATVSALGFSRDGAKVVSGGVNGAIYLWDVRGGKPRTKLEGHKTTIVALEISLDNKTLFSADKDGVVKIWDVVQGKETRSVQLVVEEDSLIALQGQANRVLVGSKQSNAVRIWNLTTGKPEAQLDKHEAIEALALFTDGHKALTIDGQILRLWKLP